MPQWPLLQLVRLAVRTPEEAELAPKLIELFRAAGFFVVGKPGETLQVSWAPAEPAAPFFRDFD